jgi:hypothetical protein
LQSAVNQAFVKISNANDANVFTIYPAGDEDDELIIASHSENRLRF